MSGERPQQVDLFGSPVVTPETRRRAKRVNRTAINRVKRERVLEDFWAANLALPFKKGINIWQTHGKENPTLAGYSVNVASSMLDQVGSENEFKKAFEDSINRVSAQALTRKIKQEARRAANYHSIDIGLMLNYAEDIVITMIKARGISPSYAEKLRGSIFKSKFAA